jgi:thymidylate synthase
MLCTGINANYSREVAAAEAIQLIAGTSISTFAVKHAPNLAAFRNQSGTFDGAYGPRVAQMLGLITERLKQDRDTRQAIIPIWRPEDVRRRESKDYPCTLTLGFFIREHRLELDVSMRSNDTVWGLKYDLLQFSQLQLTVANVLGIRAGTYRHTASSMHIYEPSWSWVDGLDGSTTERPIADHPFGIEGSTIDAVMQRARRIVFGSTLPEETSSERWYREQLS